MNIFVTDPSPTLSARCLPDKHIVKMPLETCQMLSIVCSKKWGHDYGDLHRINGEPYKTEKGAFRNHPCTIWANACLENTWWLLAHGLALCNEYSWRYGKIHSCEKTLEEATTIIPSAPAPYLPKSLLSQGQMSLNMTQALTLLLLTNVIYRANLGLHLIIFVTHPENRIGYD